MPPRRADDAGTSNGNSNGRRRGLLDLTALEDGDSSGGDASLHVPLMSTNGGEERGDGNGVSPPPVVGDGAGAGELTTEEADAKAVERAKTSADRIKNAFLVLLFFASTVMQVILLFQRFLFLVSLPSYV